MKILSDHDLSRYGTYQIGGSADFFVEVDSEKALLDALKWAHDHALPYFVFGGASNLLFDDEGFRGLVIRIRSAKWHIEGEYLHAEAGLPIAYLVDAALKNELGGMEAWAGLPGTVGGAVYGNAGCFGLETKDILHSARLWIPYSGVIEKSTDWFEYCYRNSKLKHTLGIVVLSAIFKLKKSDSSSISNKMKKIRVERMRKQPPGLSTGSFFKNPEGCKSAGRLIEEAGLKGFQKGPVQISPYHANFFMNLGGARSKDIHAMAEYVQKKVKAKHGIELEREVIFVPSGR